MYGNSTQGAIESAMLAGDTNINYRNTTVAENIDSRIQNLQDQIERLKEVKKKLGDSILHLPLEDLQTAMNRY